MRLALILLALPAFGQEWKTLPMKPPTTTEYDLSGPQERWNAKWFPSVRWLAYDLGSAAYPWTCSDPRIRSAKPGQYAHIYCTTKSGVLLVDGKPVKPQPKEGHLK